MNHIGNANKMVSETPISDSTPHNVADLGMLCRRLERKLNAANDRIQRMEELGKELRECASQLGWTSSDDSRWIERAEAAVEAWDKEVKL